MTTNADLKFKRTAALDLSKHLDARIKTVFEDFMDRCNILDIAFDEATTLALTISLHYAAAAGIGVEATEDEFALLSRYTYRTLKRVNDVD